MDENLSIEDLKRQIKQLEHQLLLCRQSQQDPLALPHGESKLYEMVENLNEVIYATDEKGSVTYVSPNIEAVSGYRREEVIGRSFLDFVYPEDMPNYLEQFLDLLNGKSKASEYQFVTKNRGNLWVRTDARQVVSDGKVSGVHGVLVDVTERKEAEEALKASEEKYRILVENAKDAVFVTQDGVVKFMNPVADGFLGYGFEAVKNTPFLDFIHPDDQELIRGRYEKRMRGEPVSDAVMFRVINRQGEEKSVDLNAVMIDWEGKPAVLNFLRDITPQKKLEDKLQRAQRLEAVGTLAGGIAHNFNNLLMGIQGNAAQVLRGTGETSPWSARLRNILDLVQSGSQLTTQLLGYARDGRYEVQAVDLNRMLKTVSETVAAAKRDITFQLNLSRELDEIDAERGQIEQVIYNLFINAADAMPRGGSVFVETVGASREDVAARKLNRSKGKYVRLMVRDSGTGMTPEVKEHMFDPFFTTKDIGEGTGLGLSSVYGIVKGHGGTIEVESRPGEGTAFTIFLPAASRQSEAIQPVATREVKAGRRVMVVDDEPVVLEVTVELLENLGFTVTAYDNGKDAVRYFEQNADRIDLVMLDLTMPNMGGSETFDRVRQIDPHKKVLLCSGYGQDSQAEEILSRGCNGFIQKPYNLKKLSNKLNEILISDP